MAKGMAINCFTFLNVMGAELKVWQLPSSCTFQKDWWQNPAMLLSGRGKQDWPEKTHVPAEIPEKETWKTRWKTKCSCLKSCRRGSRAGGWQMPPLLQSPAAGNQIYARLCWSLSQRTGSSSGKESSEWIRESLTHTEASSNVVGKTMPIFNTDLQHHEFMTWFVF